MKHLQILEYLAGHFKGLELDLFFFFFNVSKLWKIEKKIPVSSVQCTLRKNLA